MLSAVSFVVAVGLFWLVFEVVSRVQYDRWRAGYDNNGNLERITIASKDPTLMWEYKPYGTRPSGPPVTTNRYGFRDRDFAIAKSADERRVAFIGDSVTLGLWVAEPKTFVRQFEVSANARGAGPAMQALNFGIDGYNARQVGRLLSARVVEFEPDVVVYTLCMNDFDFEDSSGEKILYFRRPRSFLLRWLRKRIWRNSGTEYHHYYFAKNQSAVLSEIDAMQKLLNDRGVPFIVAVAPVFSALAPDGQSSSSASCSDIEESLIGLLERRGVTCFALRDAFARAGRPISEFALDPWHPNPAGHRLIAEALQEPVLRAMGE